MLTDIFKQSVNLPAIVADAVLVLLVYFVFVFFSQVVKLFFAIWKKIRNSKE